MKDLRAAYEFLKHAAFHDMPLPKSVRLDRRPLKKAWGYFYDDPKIQIDSSIKTGDRLLKVMAHEMVHATLHQSGACDGCEHGAAFNAVAQTVCERMGWKRL